MKGQSPRAFVVLKSGSDVDPDELSKQVVATVRELVGPVAAMKEVVIVPGLPKTRSGRSCARRCEGSPTAARSRSPPPWRRCGSSRTSRPTSRAEAARSGSHSEIGEILEAPCGSRISARLTADLDDAPMARVIDVREVVDVDQRHR